MKFDYFAPATQEEAIKLLSKYDGKAKVIAGGTDLVVRMKNKFIKPEYVIDLENISGLDSIKYNAKQGMTIGALTKVSAVENSPLVKRHYPALAFAAGQLGSVAIRNLATIGGNLCNAAPSAENAPSLLCLSARVKIVGPNGTRELPLEEFFAGPGKTVLDKGEILTEIRIPAPVTGSKAVYFKHCPRGGSDLAIVGVAAMAVYSRGTCKDIKVALGAVASTPIRANKAEQVLIGKKVDEKLINKCAAVAAGEACCISDVRGSAEYRREMVEVFTRRAIKALMA
ncbi:FAD binding domain-containing protein [Chloroflexota bacterium]